MDDFDSRTSAEILNPSINLTPKTILTLAHKDPNVAYCVIRWEKGELTWEQTLIAIILLLAERNNNLIQELVNTSYIPQKISAKDPLAQQAKKRIKDFNLTDNDNRNNQTKPGQV